MARPAGPAQWLSKHSCLAPRTHLIAVALAALLVLAARTLLVPPAACRRPNSPASCGGGPASALGPGSNWSSDSTTERIELWLSQDSTHNFLTPRSACVVHRDGELPLNCRWPLPAISCRRLDALPGAAARC